MIDCRVIARNKCRIDKPHGRECEHYRPDRFCYKTDYCRDFIVQCKVSEGTIPIAVVEEVKEEEENG